jgi:hypothetical protein
MKLCWLISKYSTGWARSHCAPTLQRFIFSINVHKLAQQMGGSYGRTCRVLKKHLHPHPYKVTSVHELKERDSVKYVEYCWWFRDIITANGEYILDITFFTTELVFHLFGYVNSCVCLVTNLHEIKDTPLHDQKGDVWCTMSRNWIIGPIFFIDTISSESYCHVILYPFIGHINEDEVTCGYLQQGDVMAHSSGFHDATAPCVRRQ